MVTLFSTLNRETADTYALVLASASIPHRIGRTATGWELCVAEADFAAALAAVRAYTLENPLPAGAETADAFGTHRDLSGLWVAVGLALVYALAAAGVFGPRAAAVYGASARHILEGETYRCVTALMLHGDLAHLAGNMLGIALFGSAVGALAGRGLGWLSILAAGALGNYLNARLYQVGHLSVGASTAVFGALGFLGGWLPVVRWRQPGRRRWQALLPFGAGVALLGFMGAGTGADLGAHLFGFLSGVLLGGAAAAASRWVSESIGQERMLIASLLVVVAAWLRLF